MSATVRRAEGADAAGIGDGGDVIVEDAPVSLSAEARVTETGDYRFFAGWRGDPFFFDAEGALSDFQFTGNDFFADKDVCSIVLEVPNDALGASGRVGLWHRTLVPGGDNGAGWVQADRGAKLSQAVFFSPGEEKAAYLGGEPATDDRFVDSFGTCSNTPAGIRRTTRGVWRARSCGRPRLRRATGVPYPENGRALTDDATDHFLAVFTNGQVTGDQVGPHTDLLTEFPYLGHRTRRTIDSGRSGRSFGSVETVDRRPRRRRTASIRRKSGCPTAPRARGWNQKESRAPRKEALMTRYEYKVIDTGGRVEEKLNRLGAEELAGRRRDDQEAAVHRAAPGDHPDA